METDKKKGKSANGDYESDIGDSSFSDDNFDDDDDYLSDMNDSGEVTLPCTLKYKFLREG